MRWHLWSVENDAYFGGYEGARPEWVDDHEDAMSFKSEPMARGFLQESELRAVAEPNEPVTAWVGAPAVRRMSWHPSHKLRIYFARSGKWQFEEVSYREYLLLLEGEEGSVGKAVQGLMRSGKARRKLA